ncbi:Homeobox domain-containing protein/START domain-containing protein [Artemisia annua]|uniref:Homeobox domain-containing protein/START domain-containing protein n=1 Tax=Artemisia annua TaxID=35608 RepID=A0A2U1P749_ARTAN|nr:Homeobox domain-containing protein/START domain-containing protein [Artemisia annua]
MEAGKYKLSVVAAVHELRELFKYENNDLWIKSEEGRDVLVPHKYQQAFPWWYNNKHKNNSLSWTTEASRASALVMMDHLDLAVMLAEEDWSFTFPHMVAKEETIQVLLPAKEDTPDGTLLLVRKELQASSPCMIAKRKFTLLRACMQIDQGTWVVAEISHCPPNNFRRLPSGCLIQNIAEDLSKVTWVEHMEVEESLPNQTFYNHLIRSGFAFGAERIVSWLERSCERGSHLNATSDMYTKARGFEGKEVTWVGEKLDLMEFGDCMVRGLFEKISPNDDCNSTLWRSVTGSEDLKVYASLYKSYSNLYMSPANFEVAGGVVAFGVKHSPEFVLETLGDERIHHEIEGSNKMLIKEVNVNRSGSLVMWSTVSKKDFDLIINGKGLNGKEDPVLISGFSISTDGHTTATNTGGSVITLVLRMLVDGNQPLQEKRQQSIDSITFAINQTVGRVKEALEKQRPPSPSRDWQQVGVDDIASDQILQDELRVLNMN